MQNALRSDSTITDHNILRNAFDKWQKQWSIKIHKHNKWDIPRVYDGGSTGGKRKPSFIRIIADLSSPNVEADKMVKFTDGSHSK
jgi:hypothetical protein